MKIFHFSDLFETKNLHHHHGFTLMEILVAVLIFGTIMMTLFSTFRSFVASSRLIRHHIAGAEKGPFWMTRMLRDIRSIRIAFPPEYQNPSETDGLLDPFRIVAERISMAGHEFSTLSFVSLSHISFEGDVRTGAARITYYPRERRDGGIDLCRSDHLISKIDHPVETELSSCDPVLCRNIVEFDLTFIDDEGEKSDHWDSDAESFDRMTPRAIHLSMAFTIDDGTSLFTSSGDRREPEASVEEYRMNRGTIGEGGNETDGNHMVKRIETELELPFFRKKEK